MKNLLLLFRRVTSCSKQLDARSSSSSRRRKKRDGRLTATGFLAVVLVVIMVVVAAYCSCGGGYCDCSYNVVQGFSLHQPPAQHASSSRFLMSSLLKTTVFSSKNDQQQQQQQEEEEEGTVTTTTATTTSAADHDDDNDDDDDDHQEERMEQQIVTWRQQAAVARREAAEMERKLTMEKIAKLEAALLLATAATELNKNSSAAAAATAAATVTENPDRKSNATTTWTEQDRQEAQKQLHQLQQKLEAAAAASAGSDDSTIGDLSSNSKVRSSGGHSASSTTSTAAAAAPASRQQQTLIIDDHDALAPSNRVNNNNNIQTGYSKEDLALYLPVAMEIQELFQQKNATSTTANTNTTFSNTTTIRDQLAAFRSDPRLQQHFQQKIQQLLVEPLQTVRKLEELRKQYLASNSAVEKKQIKREMAQLQKILDRQQNEKSDNSDDDDDETNLLSILPPPLNDLDQRLADLERLPVVLQAIYLQRVGLPIDDDDNDGSMVNKVTLSLAIQLEYYDDVVEALLYRIPDDDGDKETQQQQQARRQVMQVVQALPQPIQVHLARKLGMYTYELKDDDDDDDDKNGLNATDSSSKDKVNLNVLVDKLLAPDDKRRRNLLQNGRKSEKDPTGGFGGVMVTVDAPDFLEDIDYIDRSRYIAELYPALGRLEEYHPTERELEIFTKEILSKKPILFQVSDKPDRVMGGYYIRGYNRIANDNSGVELTARLQHRLANSSTLKDKFDFYFIMDPSPMSDESYEMGYGNEPVLFVSSKNATAMYNLSALPTKLFVSTLAIISVWLFALASCDMQPVLQERISSAIDMGTSDDDLSWLADIASQISFSILAIQFAHEMAHRVVAWKDKFDIGLPTPIPSFQLGLHGAITPLKSPPPTLKSLFDFAISGPIAGLVASMAFLLSGLDITASATAEQVAGLPAIPVYLLQSSALGGGLVEMFLGKGVLRQGITANSVLQLHPFAIAGFVGLVANALALLPLGHTDGGRIAIAMFGRRGAFIVKTFTGVLICIGGLFGLDDSYVMLSYVLYVLFWQRELESPARNEVEEVDFLRGALGISMGLVVALVLLPHS